MPEALAAALATPGLVWIIATTVAAGAVYGFAGFGAALIFMPVATAFVPAQLAISSMALIALSSMVTVVPGAWRKADKGVVLTMVGVALCTIPLGVAVLRVADPDMLRWAVIALAAATLAALLSGWRRTGEDTVPARLAVAGASGFCGGAVGLNGPILVLFQLSGRMRVETMRANTIVFLSVTGLAVLPAMMLLGLFDAAALALGLLLAVPYGAGTLLGRALFDPARERLYRSVAYAVIGAAIVLGLPLWS
ncbi:MAG: sulfite exporter TauE/SafE family protein [Pseudomonadota bacterium]